MRRVLFSAVMAWAGVAGCVNSAWAGGQKEEALAAAVRTALSASIARAAPPAPVFADQVQQLQFDTWVRNTENRLTKKKPEELVRREFLQTVWYEARRAGLDPGLVMGLIEVESGFRKYAISSVGARGYMQVMPFWTRQIGDGNSSTLFHMQTNLRFGCVILRHYLDVEKGNLFMALGRYNGSRGRAEYPNMVTAAWRRWKMPDSVPGLGQGVQVAQAQVQSAPLPQGQIQSPTQSPSQVPAPAARSTAIVRVQQPNGVIAWSNH